MTPGRKQAVKINCFVVVAICLGAPGAQAQPEVGVVVKGGPNAATLDGDNVDHRYGFTGGLAGYLQWPLGRFLPSAQMDLLYTQRGTDLVRADEYLGSLRLHYLDVTVTIRPGTRVGPARLYLLLGGGWNLLLHATSYGAASGMTRDVTDEASRHDLALIVGAGAAFHLPNRNLGPFHLNTAFLEARHDRGLIDIDDDSGATNRTTSLMLGVSFALGSRAAAEK